MVKDTTKIWAPETFMTNLFRHIKLVASTQAYTLFIITVISWLALRLHSIMQKRCWLGERQKFHLLCTIQMPSILMPFSIDTRRSSVLIEFSWDCLQRQTFRKFQLITGIRSITQLTYQFLNKFHREFLMPWISSILRSICTIPGSSTLLPGGSVAIHHSRVYRWTLRLWDISHQLRPSTVMRRIRLCTGRWILVQLHSRNFLVWSLSINMECPLFQILHRI